MNLRQLYESLLAGKSVTLEFPNKETFDSIYSQLRGIKSRYDASYVKVAGIDLSEGKVIRFSISSKFSQQYKFWLGSRVERTKAEYTIISIDEGLAEGDAST